MRRIGLKNAKMADGIELSMCDECDGIHVLLMDEDEPGEAFAQGIVSREDAQTFATNIMSMLGKLQ